MKKPKEAPAASSASFGACRNCKFSTPSARRKIGQDPVTPGDGRLWCRRYPPAIASDFDDVSQFRMTFADAWCGEHQLRKPGGSDA